MAILQKHSLYLNDFLKKSALIASLIFPMQLLHAKEAGSSADSIVSAKNGEVITTSKNQVRDWSEFFDESLDDLKEEKQIAKEEGKKAILVMFEMEECPFCARMKRTVINKTKVQDYYREHFRILMVDIEGDLELVDFNGKTTTQKDFSFKQNRVRATPVFQFYDLQGKPLKNGRLTGATRNAEEFLLLGQFIAEGHNQTMSFSKFKRKHKKQIKK